VASTAPQRSADTTVDQETITAAFDDQETITAAFDDQETITAAFDDQETITAAFDDQERSQPRLTCRPQTRLRAGRVNGFISI
jgi:hypothetical protein